MAAVVTINGVLDGHVDLDVECLDRIYLNGYVPNLQVAEVFAGWAGVADRDRGQLGRPRQSTRADLHACLLCGLAPAQGLGSTNVHRPHTPKPNNPVTPAQRSPAAQAKASTKHHTAASPVRSFQDLLDHLATITRERIRYHNTDIEIDKLTDPTPTQHRAFDLINAPIPPSPHSQNNYPPKPANPQAKPRIHSFQQH